MKIKKAEIIISILLIIMIIIICQRKMSVSNNDVIEATEATESFTDIDIAINEQEMDNIEMETELSIYFTDVDEDIKSDIPKAPYYYQLYQNFFDFSSDNFTYVDNKTFEFLKYVYKKIGFYGEFQKGDLEDYDYYRKKFGDYIIKTDGRVYYFFDMDGDGVPEFCSYDDSVYPGYNIHKYIHDTDEIIDWWGEVHTENRLTTDFKLNGTRKMRWSEINSTLYGDQYAFYELDRNAEIVQYVLFFNFYTDDEICMVTLPRYRDKKIEITETMKSQGYYDEISNDYYFRVTREQYDELTKDYFEAEKLAEENIKEVTYTYEELFGEY